jgi:Zn-dependent protease
MAFLWTLVLIGLMVFEVQEEFFTLMARAGVLTNLVMFAFNLFPIPPLDGGRILVSVLPHKYAYKVAQIEPYGFFIVMGLVLLKVIYTWWMAPVMLLASRALQLITWPLLAFLH